MGNLCRFNHDCNLRHSGYRYLCRVTHEGYSQGNDLQATEQPDVFSIYLFFKAGWIQIKYTSYKGNLLPTFQVRFVLFKLLVAQSSDESSTIQDWSKLTALALELLDTLSRLDPGASRNRGKVLKDLIKPFMKLAELELQTQKIDAEAYAKRKNMAKEFAKDLIMCYRYENTQNIRQTHINC